MIVKPGEDTCALAHLAAQKLIKNTGFSLNLILDRSGNFDLPTIAETGSIPERRPVKPTSSNSSAQPTSRSHKTPTHSRNVRILRSNSTDSDGNFSFRMKILKNKNRA